MPDDLILVVDDNDKNLRLATEVLRVNGFRTLEASTAREALTLAAQQLPNVILMDVRLPDMSGVEAVRRLKADPSTATIPVIALTAFAMEGQREWLLDAGFDDYIAKPIDIHTFPEAVRGHCSG